MKTKLLLLLLPLSACQFIEIDCCLDQGGRWDEVKQQCEKPAD